MSNIEELKKSHQQLIDQAAAVMLCIEKLDKKEAFNKAPEDGEEYWYIGGDGKVNETTFYSHYTSDANSIAVGNWFWTEEEAEKAALRFKVDLLLSKEAKRLNTEGSDDEWLVTIMGGSLRPMTNTSWDTGRVKFSTEAAVREAVSNVGLELIKKAWSEGND